MFMSWVSAVSVRTKTKGMLARSTSLGDVSLYGKWSSTQCWQAAVTKSRHVKHKLALVVRNM